MQELTEAEAREILGASRLGVLCMSHDGKTYGIPLFYAVGDGHVYFHCHPGMKDEYIATTKQACLTVIHMESEDIWESVQVFGKLEKLTLSTDIENAKAALYNIPFPPAKGNFPKGTPVRTDLDVFYLRLTPDRVSGMGSSFKE